MLTLDELRSLPIENVRLFHQSIYGQKFAIFKYKLEKQGSIETKRAFLEYARATAREILYGFDVMNFFKRPDGKIFEMLIPFSAKDRETFVLRVRLEAYFIISNLVMAGVESAEAANMLAYSKISDNLLDDKFIEENVMPFFDHHLKARENRAKALANTRNMAREEVEALVDCFGRLSSLYGDREGFFKTVFSLGLRTKNYWLDKRIHGIIIYAKDRYSPNIRTKE